MRVITGKAKGRHLKAVPGSGTRPITDRAKSALFSIIGSYVIGARFLDLFSGTGSVGIEALSRGAQEVVFVERGRLALRTIYGNLETTGLREGAHVEHADVFNYLAREPTAYDFIYVAPPQYEGLWADTLRLLDQNPEWLCEDGWAIAQIHPREYEDLALQNLTMFDQRTYGSVMLCFYDRLAEAGDE